MKKIFGHFETDNDVNRHGSQQNLLEDEKLTQSQEDDLRRKYLNEPSAKPIPIGEEILGGRSKRTTILSYLRDMFKIGERYRLERDEDGYVKKLYSEKDDSSPKSDEIAKLMRYMNEFFRAKPKQLEEKNGKNFGDKIQKLLAKVIAHHGNEWCQDMDDAGNESGDTKGLMEAMPSIRSEQLELDKETDSIKAAGNETELEKLLTKIVAQHGSEWFQDLDERGDTNLQDRDKQAEGLLQQLLETKNENSPAGSKFKGDGLPEAKRKILSYIIDLLETKLNDAQDEVKAERGLEEDNLIMVKSEKLEDTENVISEDHVLLDEEEEEAKKQVELRQTTNEYDAKIRAYVDGLFESKSESDVRLAGKTIANSSPFPEESEEIVSVATDFEKGEADNQISGIAEADNKISGIAEADNQISGIAEADNQVSGIVENEIGQETCDVCNPINCAEVPKTQADEFPPPIGLISCAVDVAKIFSKRNYPPDEEKALSGEEELAAASQAIQEEELDGNYAEEEEEDLFEEALDQYSHEEYSLIKPLGTGVLPSHKQGSILHKIYNSGYKYILPQSVEQTSLLHQCRQFLSSPNIPTATNFTTEPWADHAKNTTVNSTSESVKNEDVFEDARDFLFEKANEGPHSYKSEEFLQPSAQVKTEIRFLVGGKKSSQIIVLGKNEEEETPVQDAFPHLNDEAVTEDADGHSLTIFAPENPSLPKLGRIYGAVQDAKLDMQGSDHKQLTTKDNLEEPHESNWNSTTGNVLHNALLHLEERLGRESIPLKRRVKSEIRFLPPETNDDSQAVSDVGGGAQSNARNTLVSGKNEPEVEEIAMADKIEAHDLGNTFENDEMNIPQKMLNKN